MAEHNWRQTCNNLLHRQRCSISNYCAWCLSSNANHQKKNKQQQQQCAGVSENPQTPRPRIHMVPRPQPPANRWVLRVPFVFTRTRTPTPPPPPLATTPTATATATTTSPVEGTINLNKKYSINICISPREIVISLLIILISYILGKY